MKKKESKYNYIIKQNSYAYLVYNTLYSSLAILDDLEYQQLKGYIPLEKTLKIELSAMGFLVSDNLDEFAMYQIIRGLYMEADIKRLDLTIISTTKCNARCVYCYEEKIKKENMTIETANAILHYIEINAENKDITINWFGGEPLMNIDIIHYICEKLQEREIVFQSTMVTNGYYLNHMSKDILKSKMKIESIQITLDGTEDIYRQRKRYKKPCLNPFQKVLDNIMLMASYEIHISVRLNIDKENREDILELIKFLRKKIALNKYIHLYTAFLNYEGQDEHKMISAEERVSVLKEIYFEMPLYSSTVFSDTVDSFPLFYPCMISDFNSIVIDANGNIYDCEHNVGCNHKKIGNIKNDFIDNVHKRKIRGEEIIDKCSECVFLPKCLGGCYAYRIRGTNCCAMERYLLETYLLSL